MQAKLLKYLECSKKSVVSFLSDLVEVPTINPPGENYEAIVYILEKRCKSIGLKTRKYITPKAVLDKFGIKAGSKRISLVADWLIGLKETLHINSHYDVVPATDKWKSPPFKAIVKHNRIYGRGTEDMKGNIASLFLALEAVKKCGITPKLNLQVSFTPDEETGGRTGLGYLVERNLVKADYAMSEGYSMDYVSIGNKGVIWAEVTIRGKAHHASMPQKGVNSFERMVELAAEFKKLERKISRRKTRYHMRDAATRTPSFVMGGLLEGGVKVNIVPGIAKFSIDRRLIPEEDLGAVQREIEDIIRRFNKVYKDSKASIKFITKERPSISKEDRGFFKTIADSIKSVTGRDAKFSVMPGATDVRYFMWKGIPSVGYSASGGESWHSDNEFVYIDSLIDTAKVYALVMSQME